MKLIDLLERDFADIAKKKNRWIEALSRGDLDDIKENLFVLIDGAYGAIGGHVKIRNVNDILNPKMTYWEAIDLDEDPDADAVLFGKQSHGIKISGIGHDSSHGGKKELMARQVRLLKKPGYWVEASGKPAEIMIRAGLKPASKEEVEKVFGEVDWKGDGKYLRKRSSDALKGVEKALFGKPKA
jgi:hypothetical protein